MRFASTRAASRRRAVRTGVALVAVLGAALGSASAAQAAVVLTPLTTESFSNATTADTQWIKPSGTNVACLTAGTDTSRLPVPGCGFVPPDAAGSGTLHLTDGANNQVGTVYSTVSLPTAQGLDVSFDSYQYGGTVGAADGISFVLAATDPTDPAPPAVNGPLGGSLGYSAAGATPGVAHGYLGFGLDVFGNYSNSSFGGSGCTASAAVPESVVVRGPGDGTAGYCILQSAPVQSGGLDKATQTSRPAPVPVEIAVNPSGAATTTPSGLSVAADSWTMSVGAYTGTKVISGTLPSAAGFAPASWLNAAGLPYQLTFGWAASTGGDNEVHEINMLASTTVNGPLPEYALAVGDDAGGTVLAGNGALVSVTPSLVAGQGSEAQPATVTTTFPTGITPQAGTFDTNGYACTGTGQVASCTFAPPTPVAAGSAFPTAQIPVSVSASAAGAYTIRAKVSSVDANPASAGSTVDVSTFTATASGPITYGAGETLTAVGLPASATGSVTFADASGTLCTVADLTSGTSCTVASPAPGSYAVTATYRPDGTSPFASQTATTAFTVSQAGAPFTAEATPAAASFGSAVTLSALGLPADGTGDVVFADAADTVLCTIPDIATGTSCSAPAGLAPGDYAVTAQYSGDTDYTAASASTRFTVSRASVPIEAAVSDPSVGYGTTDTLSVSGLPTAGSLAATGSVSFTDGAGATLCTATLPATSCSTDAALGAGSYQVTAHYPGDADYAAADSSAVQLTVTRAPVVLTAAAASSAVTYGDTDTLSYAGLTTGGPTAANGTVSFTDGSGAVLCTAALPATSCTTAASLPAGSYQVVASYGGDANHQATAATAFPITVGRHGVAGLTAQATPASTAYGSADTLSYAGLVTAGATGATGTVTFTAGGATLCSAELPQTSCTAPQHLVVGHYAVTAAYSGDGNYSGGTATAAFDVTKAATDLVVAAGAASLPYGTAQTLSYSGVPVTGSLAAGGTVTFADAEGHTLCTATLPATSCSTPIDLAAGSYRVTAAYSGDGNYAGSSATVSFTVTPVATAVSLAPASGTHGTGTALAVGGLPTAGVTAAAGTVTFTDGNGTLLCVATLPRTGCAAPGDLRAGHYLVTATYSGDADHAGSSAASTLDIAKGRLALVEALATASPTLGQQVLVTLRGVPADATGRVRISSRGRLLCTAVLPARTCTLPGFTRTGSRVVTASYTGDDNYAAASATAGVAVAATPRVATTVTARPGSDGATAAVGVPRQAGGSVTVVGAPAHGTVRLLGGRLVYSAAAGYSGADAFTYRVTHADGSSTLTTVRVAVPGAPAQAGAGGLASTGVDIRGPLVLGGGLLVAGAVLAVVARRRTSG